MYYLVTIDNDPSPLKDRIGSNLHNGSCLPDKIKSIFYPLTTIVTFIAVLPKVWLPKPNKITN